MNSQIMPSVADGNSSAPDSDDGGDSNNKDPDKNQQKAKVDPESVKSTVALSPSRTTKKPRFVEELKPEDVRWFYKKTAQDKSWQPLNGHDSLAIEHAYRRGLAETKIVEETQKMQCGSSSKDTQSNDVPPVPQNVVAFGGLYRLFHACEIPTPSDTAAVLSSSPKSPVFVDPKCNIKEKKNSYQLIPIYWEDASLLLTRGTWFLEASGGDWQPLDAVNADFVQKIEKQHIKTFAGQRVPDQPVYFEKGVRPTLCEVADADEEKYPGTGVRVRWHSVIDIYLFNNKGSRVFRYLKFQGSGTKLMRGYHTEAKIEDGPAPVTDLVFVIHGIGQKRQQNKIVMNTTSVREIAEQLLRTYYAGNEKRPMFLPIDWRSELRLDEEAVNNITPMDIQELRHFFNESLMDLMYYTSPLYHSEILQGMVMVLNRVYKLYLQNDPTFESRGGRVSFMAHSLGSVIAYDLLTGYAGPDVIREFKEMSISKNSMRLHFKTAHLFCFGSPLGVFLACRGLRGLKILEPVKDEEDGNSAEHNSFKMHNVYHPADPVAYRIEPLVSAIYAQVRPLRIHHCTCSKVVPYEGMPAEILEKRLAKARRTSRSMSPSASCSDLKSVRQLSDSDESIYASGVDSDEGSVTNSKMIAIAKQETPASPKSTARSWSAAVFERFGMGKHTGKDGGPRVGSPEPVPSGAVIIEEVQDEEKKADKLEKVTVVAETTVCAPIEQASEAQEISPKQPGAAEKSEPMATEKSPKTEFVIPVGQAVPYRMDFTLRPGRMEISYWAAAIYSHVSYWTHHDAIMYVLSSLYGQPKLPQSPGK